MRRILVPAVVALSAVACGKSRLAGGETRGRWDEPTAANGFHGEADRACDFACVPRVEVDRPKHAVRISPSPRVAPGSLPPRDRGARATRGDEVCWIDTNEWVKCARGGAHPETIAHSPGIDDRFLAMDEEAFYVMRGGWITRLARGADTLDALAKAELPVRDLALSAGILYWTERGEPRLECRPDGTKPSCTARDRKVRHPFGTLHRVSVVDRHAELLAAELEEPDGLLVVADHVYVATGQGLVRAPAHGGPPTVLPTGEPAIGRPALDPVSWTVYVQTRDKLLAVEP